MEPKLKYSTYCDSSLLTEKDGYSAIVIDKFIAVGTLFGRILILDSLGTLVRELSAHSATVNQLALDDHSEFLISASDDGSCIIHNLYSHESLVFNRKRPVKGASLEPDFSKGSRSFVSGGTGENLVLSAKGWFGYRDLVLYSGQNPIVAVDWKKDNIVWAGQGIHFYDTTSQLIFGHVKRDSNELPDDLFHCHFSWKSEEELLIGWGNDIILANIKCKNSGENSIQQEKYVETIFQIKLSFIVSGIAPFLDDTLLIFAYNVDLGNFKDVNIVPEQEQLLKEPDPPTVNIIQVTGDTLFCDEIDIPDYKNLKAKDFKLAYLESEQMVDSIYYILAPSQIILAKPRNLDDRIEWLVENKCFKEAFELAREKSEGIDLRPGTLFTVGQKYLQFLFNSKDFKLAAELCPEILDSDPKAWQSWVYKFAENNQLGEIFTLIPFKNTVLDSPVYELILSKFLDTDKSLLLKALELWPSSIFHLKNVIKSVNEAIKKSENDIYLIKSLFLLYMQDKNYMMALKYGLALKKPGILSLVADHNLHPYLPGIARDMMRYDFEIWGENYNPAEAEGLRILTENDNQIPIKSVVESLSKDLQLLHIYLDRIFQRDLSIGGEFHDRQVALYAEFEPSKLLDFLKSSLFYSIQDAYNICEKRDFVPEMVYLLGKMGNNRKALMLIIERLDDVKKAIDFAKEQNDEDLWEDLLNYSMSRPRFIVALLENLGLFIDPFRVISRIPNGLKIPNLKPALLQVLRDLGTQISLREGCKEILFGDTIELLESINTLQSKGLVVEGKLLNRHSCKSISTLLHLC